MAYASLTPNEIQPLVPALQSNWLISHVVTCFIGYAAFCRLVRRQLSLPYQSEIGNRTREKRGAFLAYLPSSEALDEVGYKTIAIVSPF